MAGGKVYEITGKDRETFLQGLVTNDLKGLDKGPVYAAILTPQGKYLADFFLVRQVDALLLDVAPALAEGLVRRLNMYRLRADVQIAESSLSVAELAAPAAGALPDPRHPAMGWRLYGPGVESDDADRLAVRVAQCIPESGIELVPDESYVLECGFERLHGVDFRKGCYVGQEVTARMKHKTELRKGLAVVDLDGAVPVGTEILAEGKAAGKVLSQSGGRAIAYLRFDRAQVPMEAGGVAVRWDGSQPG